MSLLPHYESIVRFPARTRRSSAGDPAHRVADALRVVALRLELAMDEEGRSGHIDAYDLLESLLAVTDQLDPPMAEVSAAGA